MLQTNPPGSGGADQNAAGGGSGNENSQSTQSNDESSSSSKPDDKVAFASFQKVLDEKKALQAKLDAVEAEKRTRVEQEAREKEDYKKIVELREQELAEIRAKLEETGQKLTEREIHDQNRLKLSSFLGALKGKIEQKYWDLIPIDKVAIDPGTGKVDEMSVTRAVESFRQQFPEVIIGAGGPRLPNDAPGDKSGATIAYADWLKLSPADMKKWDQSQIRG